MTYLRERMKEDLQLRGLSKKTQQGYLRAVRQLAEYCKKPPDEIDGPVHALQKVEDTERTDILSRYGLTVLRFSNREVMNDLNSVLGRITDELKSNPLSWRKGVRG